MRATITVLLVILPVLILGCTLDRQAPTQDVEATLEARVEATFEARMEAQRKTDKSVSATVEARLKKQSAHNPTAAPPATADLKDEPVPMEQTGSIRPVGGVGIERAAAINCDSVFRNQLVFQRGASTADRMNVLVSQIQSQHQECNPEVWNPVVIDLDNNASSPAGKCFSDTAGTLPPAAATMPTIGAQVIPTSVGNAASATTYWVQKESGRDSENNILVYFSDAESNRPSDGASCWLYYARLRTWHHGRASLPPFPALPVPTKPYAPPTPELDGGTRTPPTPTPVPSPTAEEVIPEWAYENHPSLTEYILNLPWASGSLTAFEINTIELLVRYAVIRSNGIEYAINENLLAEPDPFAIDIIQEFASFERAPEVADPRQIKVERRLIDLPLRGQTNLLILRAQPGSAVAMDLLENAVRSAERFMGVPFPTDQVTLRFTGLNVTSGYDGSFNSGRVQILPTFDQRGNEKHLAEIIAHEVAHYYWHHHANWIDEGMAETLAGHIENDRVGTPIALSNPPCSLYQSIVELEIDRPKRSEFSKFGCNYSMGQSLFLGIGDVIGKQKFIQGARRLYKTRTAPHIESVKSAFPNSGETRRVINQHYYGDANPQSIRPSPQLPTIQLTSASLHLEREQTLPPWDNTPLRSLSASKYYGPLVLFVTTSPHGQGGQPYVTLTVKHAESDWSEQRIIEPSTRSSTLHRIGPRRTPWLPGNYLASIEQQGKKLAEISWTVTP